MQTLDPNARKLRILHVLRAPLGGLFRHVVDLTRAQVERGHEVGLITDSTTGGERAAEVLAQLEPLLALGVMRAPMHRLPHLSDITTFSKVMSRIREQRPDVVHGHGSKGGLYARMSGFAPGAGRAVRAYTPHGGSFNYKPGSVPHHVFMAIEKLLDRRTDIFLFESAYIQGRFHAYVGDTSALTRVILNGISPAELIPVATAPNPTKFLYVGELRAAKGIDTLIAALAQLSRRSRERPRLTLVGSGPDQEQLTNQARALGVADLVTFAGAMPARAAFALGEILVVPSRAESLPYIVIEAAGAHLPMVATNVGGMGEIFGPFRHRLIPCNEVNILADAMESAVNKEPATLRAEAGELADFVATNFTVAGMAEAVILGYREAMAARLGQIYRSPAPAAPAT